MADALDSYPTLFVSGLPPSITELDLVKVLNEMKMETKVVIERDQVTATPLGHIKLIFRYQPDAERFFATVNGSMFLGAKVQLTFKDPNMNFSNTSGSKTIVCKHIPRGVTSLEFYEVVRPFGRIISCKVMVDRTGTESYALLQYENQDHADKCLNDVSGVMLKGSQIAMSWQFPKNSPYQYPTTKGVTPRASFSKDQPLGPGNPTDPNWTGTPAVAPAASPNGWSQPPAPGTPPPAGGWTSGPNHQWQSGPQPGGNWSQPHAGPPSTSPIPPSQTGWHQGPGSPVPNGGPAPALHAWELPPPSSDSAVLDEKNLYVKNLEDHIDNLELFNMFRKFGRIISARVMRDDVSGRSKGFGFVSFEAGDQAARALREMNGKRYGLKSLVVNVAEPKGYRQTKLAYMHQNKA
ncbi:hypothetical protein BDK51DRAFT_26946 [Blyttiomyces helicus]|uniref:RRM domain-containing protein n=1 Tax=Blyttiomyces helicus TaxID=388810 RepID=A0A4P9W3T5_9FUNG|nr:hypothetical protein BDK51DRAFT_26946 [Blyttiomyces helicus]|eukprot:RKO86989.1 hypothetical protein BDK51DRAFT_26946 [Blyttiomyces helicus]